MGNGFGRILFKLARLLLQPARAQLGLSVFGAIHEFYQFFVLLHYLLDLLGIVQCLGLTDFALAEHFLEFFLEALGLQDRLVDSSGAVSPVASLGVVQLIDHHDIGISDLFQYHLSNSVALVDLEGILREVHENDADLSSIVFIYHPGHDIYEVFVSQSTSGGDAGVVTVGDADGDARFHQCLAQGGDARIAVGKQVVPSCQGRTLLGNLGGLV